MKTSRNIPEIIEALGGASALGRQTGIGTSTISEWKRRNSIPVRYWPAIIEAAAEKRIRLTPAILMQAHLLERTDQPELDLKRPRKSG